MNTSRLYFALLLLFIFPILALAQTPGDCDGTPDNDAIGCTSNFISSELNIDSDPGNDRITINSVATVGLLGSDTLLEIAELDAGDGDDDYISIDGTVDVVSGDDVTGNGGNDSFHISDSSIVNTVFGDNVGGIGGVDSIINRGTVVDAVYGDYAGLHGNADYIENWGVIGTIYGDNGDHPQQAPGGDDVLVNLGTVSGDINGEGGRDYIFNNSDVGGSILAGGNDDRVLLQPGATGGADNMLVIDGGDGFDEITFM